MKLLQVNAVSYGSTGSIMFQLADLLEERGDQVLCTSGFTWKGCDRPDYVMTSNILEKTAHTYLARLTGRIGGFSRHATRQLLRKLDDFQPDLIHLHNLHSWFINIPMLFDYIRQHNIPVVWTLHDCWSFTGHCPHFAMIGCDKWKTGCHHCPQYRAYPQCYFDFSKSMWHRKRSWFTGVNNLTIVTPSQWLADQVKQSYLQEYPVRVINNGIDLSVFKPTEGSFRSKYHCEDKFILLGVAFDWDNRKGLDVFLELAKRLEDTFQIVLVGTNDNMDSKLPPEIISIHRTNSQAELAEIYTAADLFVNPTREDTYPTVNMESIACGTPVLTFRTGGSPEIPDASCGCAVECGDIDALEQEIRRIARENPYPTGNCLAHGKTFDKKERFREYISLYDNLMK
jgi:glycosyltransferase involved in cell wall biosynthesis